MPEQPEVTTGIRHYSSISFRDPMTPPQSPTPAYTARPAIPLGYAPPYAFPLDPQTKTVLSEQGPYPMAYQQAGPFMPRIANSLRVRHSDSYPAVASGQGQPRMMFAYSTTTYAQGHAEQGRHHAHGHGNGHGPVDKHYDGCRGGPQYDYSREMAARTRSDRGPWDGQRGRRDRRDSGLGHGQMAR